jgi:hypothetical protein
MCRRRIGTKHPNRRAWENRVKNRTNQAVSGKMPVSVYIAPPVSTRVALGVASDRAAALVHIVTSYCSAYLVPYCRSGFCATGYRPVGAWCDEEERVHAKQLAFALSLKS